jgi:hypothetical protein
MEDKKTVLVNVSYLIDLPVDKIELLDKRINELSKNINFEKESLLLKWEGTSTRVLDPATMNCGKCANCGCWTTDREKDDWIPYLCIGATVDGILLCDECLPSDHPCAF